MSNAMYVCYMVLLAVFGWLCYRFGFVAGRIEELVKIMDFIIHDQSLDSMPTIIILDEEADE